jgi:HK97 family phage major capsid protein
MTELEIKSQIEQLAIETKSAVDFKISEATKDLASKSQIADLEAKAAKLDVLESALREQGIKMTEMEAKSVNPQPMSIKSQIEKWHEDNKAAIEAVKNGSKADLPQMHLKAAITMTDSASLNGSAYLPNAQVQPGIVDLVRVNPTFWERLPKGRTNANPYVWVNKTNKQGNATFIGEGVLKPLASFELETETSVPKKVAERMKASTELLYDVAGMESFIRQELQFEVMTAANAAVLTGVGSSTSPAGVTTIASAYTLTSISTENPTNSDAIRAAIAQIRSLNFNGTLTAYMNPIDMANMDLEKAQDSGVYMLPPFTSADGRVIAGVQIIEDNNIAVGNLLVGDMSKYRILMYQDFFVQFGWENDDFSKNLVTIIGEMRFHQFYSSNDTGAWIYDTFANIKTALEPAVV